MKHRTIHPRWILIGLVLLLLAVGPVVTHAQGGMLNYGDNVQGSLSAQAPLGFYTFAGAQGDLVTATVIGLTPGLQPTVSLLNASGSQVAFSANDPITPLPNDATLTRRLSADGTYTLLVGSANFGSSGEYILFLSAELPETGASVSEDAPAEVEVQPATAQVFDVQANPDAPTVVNFSSQPPGFLYTVYVRNPDGQLIATLDGSIVQNSALSLAAADGVYQIRVVPNGNVPGTVSVSVGEITPLDDVPEPVTTEEAAAPQPVTATPDADACQVAVTTPVAVRSGPSQNFDLLGELEPNVFYPLLGRSNINAASLGGNTDFFLIVFATTTGATVDGWLPFTAFLIEGDCTEVPSFVYEATPEVTAPAATEDVTASLTATLTATEAATNAAPGQPSATFTPSYTPPATGPTATALPSNTSAPPTAAQVQPTATFTPTYTATAPAQATPTYTPSYTPTTPPAAQVAPQDARFNNPLTIPLDNTTSVLDFVSYPEGDTEDRVRYSVSGMNNVSTLSGGRARLVISVSCFGQNTDQMQFFTGGQTYSCGQTIVDREVTAQSDTGSIVITAVGGEGTYVQWVLTGTATRIN